MSILPDSPSCPSKICWEGAKEPQINIVHLRINCGTHLRVDVRYNTTLGDDDIAKELVQSLKIRKNGENRKGSLNSLFIIPDGKL